jgi:uncharacterized protein YggE
MNRRSFIAMGGVGITTAMAGCMDGGGDVRYTVEETSQKTIEVRGTGEVPSDPTQAVIQFSVEATDRSSAQNVVSELAEKSNSVTTTLEDVGIAEDDIQTRNYSLYFDDRESQYEGRHQYSVTVQDPDTAGSIIDTLVESSADTIGGVNFTLDEETREELYDQAVQNAVEDARKEAEMYAEAANVRLVETLQINPSSRSYQPVRYERVADTAGGGSAPPTEIKGGDVTVTATVTIRYRIESA